MGINQQTCGSTESEKMGFYQHKHESSSTIDTKKDKIFFVDSAHTFNTVVAEKKRHLLSSSDLHDSPCFETVDWGFRRPGLPQKAGFHREKDHERMMKG